ncbi:response regulator, partial [Desulfobacterales bacterium HSG17]|nr:response regulator [Desulfobacterales bacterium HSG17]
MHSDVIILVAEDDEGHAKLIKKNLTRAGIINKVQLFKNGQEILDFLFQKGKGPKRESGKAYILLLDIRMPKVDGVQVLEQIKADPTLRTLPVIMITTTDDPREVVNCHELGCSNYITKPIDYENFINAVRQLGLFLSVVQV